jgi:hypothetical protein
MKKRLGLPDPRLPQETDAISDRIAEIANSALGQGAFEEGRRWPSSSLNSEQVDELVSRLTEQILGFIKKSA